MIYLLDTDTLIYMVRSLKPARRAAQRERGFDWYDGVRRCRPSEMPWTWRPSPSWSYGAQHSGNYDQEMADSLLCPSHYGRVRDELETKGTTIGAMDLLIAAHVWRSTPRLCRTTWPISPAFRA